MSLYVRRSDGAVASFDGMTVEAIEEMLAQQGMTCEFITEADFNAAMPKPKQST